MNEDISPPYTHQPFPVSRKSPTIKPWKLLGNNLPTPLPLRYQTLSGTFPKIAATERERCGEIISIETLRVIYWISVYIQKTSIEHK